MAEIGGQAVIEGVMMRNKEKYAVAVRLKDGKIKIRKERSTKSPKIFNIIFIRGIVGLFYMLYDGIRALIWSSNQQLEKEEKLKKTEILATLFVSLLFALVFFIGIPFFAASVVHSEGFLFDLLDGLFRVALFVGYLVGISFLEDVRILFQYHGAEHKTIACYESGKPLTVENVRRFSRFHPRCGTSFIFVVLILSIITFTFISGPLWIRLAGRLLLLPVIAGIGYELIKLSSKYSRSFLVKIFIAPGLWLQRLTTREPNEKQLEIGIKALKAGLD